MNRITRPVATEDIEDISQLQTGWLGPLPTPPTASGPLAPESAQPRRAGHSDAGADLLVSQYEAESQRWLALAFRLGEDIRLGAERFARTMARWHDLIDRPTITPEEYAELTTIEQGVPELSAEIARNRQHWTTYLSWAHDLDEAARRLRAEHAPRER